MRQREIVLWVDERWCQALEKHLLDGSVADRLEEYVDELVNQLPENVYKKISGEIWQEDQKAKQEQEASRRFAVFHIREQGEDALFRVEAKYDVLHAASHLREYLRQKDNPAYSRFAFSYTGGIPITQAEFDSAVAERLENTGRVTGAFSIDMDKGEFSSLDNSKGWQTFRNKDVSTAIYFASKRSGVSWDRCRQHFFERLDGKELTANTDAQYLTGSRRLLPEEISFEDEVMECGGKLNFYVPVYFDPDAVFGTHVATDENDDYVNVYANYDLKTGRVCGELDITLVRGDGSEAEYKYKLTESDCAALLPKMEAYCQEQTEMTLLDWMKLCMEDAREQQAGGMTLS